MSTIYQRTVKLNVSRLTDPHARCARGARTAETVTRERFGGAHDQQMVRRLVQAFWRRKSFAHRGWQALAEGSVARTALPAARGALRRSTLTFERQPRCRRHMRPVDRRLCVPTFR